MNRAEYVIAESKVQSIQSEINFHVQALEGAKVDLKVAFGEDNFIVKSIDWVKGLVKKFEPLILLIGEFLNDMRPYFINKSTDQFEQPKKTNIIKLIKIGWYSGKFIYKLLKLFLKF